MQPGIPVRIPVIPSTGPATGACSCHEQTPKSVIHGLGRQIRRCSKLRTLVSTTPCIPHQTPKRGRWIRGDRNCEPKDLYNWGKRRVSDREPLSQAHRDIMRARNVVTTRQYEERRSGRSHTKMIVSFEESRDLERRMTPPSIEAHTTPVEKKIGN